MKHRRHGSQLALLAFLLAAPLGASADDWPQWRGPHRDGVSKEMGWLSQWPAEGPKKLWQGKVGVGYSTVSISDGRLYTMGNVAETDHVFCLDASSGQEVWKHSYPCSAEDPNGYHGTRCTPTVDGDKVYTVSREGHLFCLNTANGKVVWSKNLQTDFHGTVPQWGFSGSPLVEKNLLLVEAGGAFASVVALNKQTGAVVWKNGSDGAGYSSLIAYDHNNQRQFAVFARDSIVGRAMAGGAELWRFPWRTSFGVNAATPIVAGDKIFVSSGYDFGCALLDFSVRPPKVRWQNKSMRTHVNSCVLWQKNIYGFDDNELKCLDFDTGQTKWTSRSFGKGSLMAADGKLIVYSDSGKLAVAEASPAGYKQLASAQVLGGQSTWAMPVLANGKIYCRSLEKLVCLDVKAP